MDEFSNLDKEIENLKKQLRLGGEGENGMGFPEMNDYWKRRLDEEKILFAKKISAREEEKKGLESKLGQQQAQIDEYLHALKELENKFDNETRSWEERLRVKEADLLIEKNRILSEEKVKDAEIEVRRLLAQVAELNSRLNRVKDEQEIELRRVDENTAKEREAFEGRFRSAVTQGAMLEKRIEELEKQLQERCQEIEKVKAEDKERLQKSEGNFAALERKKEELEKEKVGLLAHIEELKKNTEIERLKLLSANKDTSLQFTRSLRRYFGPLVGLAHFISRFRVTASTWHIFQELIQKVDNEAASFSTRSNFTYLYNDPFKAIIVLSETEYSPWKGALVNTQAETHRVEARKLIEEIIKVKPQVVLLSSKSLRYAKAVRRRWPFMPIIISGQLDAKTTKRLLAEGYAVVLPPYVIEEMVSVVMRAAGNSIALPDYWDKIKVKRSLAPYAMAAAALILVGSASYIAKNKAVSLRNFNIPFDIATPVSVTTPYPQPTNITFDGKYLWACDWLGQSIYKQKAHGDLGIIKIFYFPGKHFSAITWAQGNLWSIDPWEKKIYRHNSDPAFSIIGTFNAPGTSPSGLAGDGDVMWSCDSSAGMIYRHALDDKLTVEASWKSPGTTPSGLFYDGKNLWSADAKTNRIYRHAIDENLTVVETFLPQDYTQNGYNISGIAKDASTFWVCSEKAEKIFQYSKDMLKKVSN